MKFSEKQIIKAAERIYIEKMQRGPSFFKKTGEKPLWYLVLNNNLFQLVKDSWWPIKQTLDSGKSAVEVIILAAQKFQMTSVRRLEQEAKVDVVQALIELKQRLENEKSK